MTINLAPSPLQDELTSTFGSMVAKRFTPQRVRQCEPLGHDPAGWLEFCSIGGLEVVVAGSGDSPSGLPEAAAVADVVGRHLAPIPFAESAAAVRLLSAVGHELVPDVLAGRRIVTLAPDGWGDGQLVPAAAVADAVIGYRDGALLLIAGQLDHVQNLGCLPTGRLAADCSTTVLVDDDTAVELWRTACADWRLLLSSALSGLAARALEIGVEQAKNRHQFGAPIGSYQAVSHRLADVATANDGARLLVAKAVWARDGGRVRAHELESMAWVQAATAAERAAGTAVHLLGGYGITEEYDAQLFFRRAKAWSLQGGGRGAGIRRLGASLAAESSRIDREPSEGST